MSEPITKESNPELHARLMRQMRGNRGATRVSLGGTEYRAYDQGEKFIPIGQSGGLMYYDQVSMSQGANRAHIGEVKDSDPSKPVTGVEMTRTDTAGAADIPADKDVLEE